MPTLILVRHGQSLWNSHNLFSGWVDVPLSKQGIDEALKCGKTLEKQPIDHIFTSQLIRSQMTAMLIMAEHSCGKVPVIIANPHHTTWSKIYNKKAEEQTIPVVCAEELNERMYGQLQGLNKTEAMQEFGKEQVQRWRRSFSEVPPGGESLEMTAQRAIPYFETNILPLLVTGKNVLVVAHGNSLRAIVMKLNGLNSEEILHFELATGAPLLYNYSHSVFTPL